MNLKDLPQNIRKVPNSKFWYVDSKTGKRIHKDNLANHIPQAPKEIERWDMKYDNY